MDAGLGRIEVAEFNIEEAEIKFTICNNFFAELWREEPACCSCAEGFVSSIYGKIIGETSKV